MISRVPDTFKPESDVRRSSQEWPTHRLHWANTQTTTTGIYDLHANHTIRSNQIFKWVPTLWMYLIEFQDRSCQEYCDTIRGEFCHFKHNNQRSSPTEKSWLWRQKQSLSKHLFGSGGVMLDEGTLVFSNKQRHCNYQIMTLVTMPDIFNNNGGKIIISLNNSVHIQIHGTLNAPLRSWGGLK